MEPEQLDIYQRQKSESLPKPHTLLKNELKMDQHLNLKHKTTKLKKKNTGENLWEN